MNIIAKGTINYYVEKYPLARTALISWYYAFEKASFKSFNELKDVYRNASIVANTRVIFNIKGNDFRLLVSVNFKKQAAFIIWFGTHTEYDKINVEAIAFDVRILNHKTTK